MKDSIRVLIADDHTLVRQGIVTFIETQDDIHVVGEATNGRDALARVVELVPDVVLMDLQMPEMDGITATREIKAQYPDIKILILTSLADESQIIPTLRAGAAGYLLKDMSSDQLMQAIRAAYRGETPLAPTVAKKLIANVIAPNEESHTLVQLTERESEVLALLGCGMSNKEIAMKLSISDKTAKFHVSSILSKLNLHDRTQAALFAVKHPV